MSSKSRGTKCVCCQKEYSCILQHFKKSPSCLSVFQQVSCFVPDAGTNAGVTECTTQNESILTKVARRGNGTVFDEPVFQPREAGNRSELQEAYGRSSSTDTGTDLINGDEGVFPDPDSDICSDVDSNLSDRTNNTKLSSADAIASPTEQVDTPVMDVMDGDEVSFGDESIACRALFEEMEIARNLEVDDSLVPPLPEAEGSIPEAEGSNCVNLSDWNTRAQETYSVEDSAYLRIMQLLNQWDCPLKSFDMLMGRLTEVAMSGFDFRKKHPLRSTLMKKFEKRFPCAKPEVVAVDLECDDPVEGQVDDQIRIAYVIRFNVVQQINDLLRDPELVRNLDFLSVNPDDPWGKYRAPNNRLGEVRSGEWYQRTYDSLITDPKTLYLLELIGYADKTGTSIMQRHALEPFMVTLGLFKEAVRNNCFRAWRHLGFIPDLDQVLSKAQKQGTKKTWGRPTRNYHRMLKVLLEPLVELQRQGNFKTWITLGDEARLMTVFVPVAFFIGDGKSGDMLCGRIAHYVQPRCCRACYCPFEELSNPLHVCKWVTRAQQYELVRDCMDEGAGDDDDLLERLREVSTNRVISALFDVDFGVNEFAFLLACVSDLLHTFKSGLVPKVLKAFTSRMSTSTKTLLEKFIRRNIASVRSSQSTFFPRVSFSGGITDMTCLGANEWVGLCMVYLIVSTMYTGRTIIDFDDDDKKFSKKRQREELQSKKELQRLRLLANSGVMNASDRFAVQRRREEIEELENDMLNSDGEDTRHLNDEQGDFAAPRCTSHDFIQLLEQMLCFDACCSSKEMWECGNQDQADQFQSAVRVMLTQVQSTVERNIGNNWNFPKFHDHLHPQRQISHYGRVSGMDAEVGERGLKMWAKNFARTALKHDVFTFTKSTAVRAHQAMVLTKAQSAFGVLGEGTNSLVELAKQLRNERMSNAVVSGDGEFSVSSDHSSQHSIDTDSSQHSVNTENSRMGVSSPQSGILDGNPKYRIWGQLEETSTGPPVANLEAEWLSQTESNDKIVVPNGLLELFASEYVDEDMSLEEFSNLSIDGYTELIKDGQRYRAHPDYQSKGPWYEHAMIVVPNDYEDEITKDCATLIDGEGRAEVRSTSQDKYSEVHAHVVPARILTFFVCPKNGKAKAIVHPCRPRMEMNDERSTVLTESWHLQGRRMYTEEECRGDRQREHLIQGCWNVVDVDTILDPVYAFAEDDNVYDLMWNRRDRAGGHIVLVIDRQEYWADSFVSYD